MENAGFEELPRAYYFRRCMQKRNEGPYKGNVVDGHLKSTPVGKAILRIHKDTEEDLRARGRLLAREPPQTV